MRFGALAIMAVFATACGSSEPWDGRVVSSSSYSIFEPGRTAPPECEQLGRVHVPDQNAGVLARMSGATIEELSRALSSQVAALGANLVVPDQASFVEAAESGAEFAGVAYRCPE